MTHVPDPRPASTADTARRRTGVTVHDVARVAGVSSITVSRALNTPHLLSPATLARVRQAIERTGYVPNLLARQLNANRSARLVAALVPALSGQVFSEMIRALSDTLAERGYHLILGQTGYDQDWEDGVLEALIGRRPDGIVLTGILQSVLARQQLRASRIPVVETWDLTDDPIDMLVGFSHEAVGSAVADFLWHRGYRRPALLSGDDARARRRLAGFSQAWARHDHTGRGPGLAWLPAPAQLAHGRAGLARLLSDQPPPDAVFCSSDTVALGALTEMQARGMTAPDDIAIVGFGDLDFASSLHPPLTSVRIDGQAIGGQAAQWLMARTEGQAVPGPHIVDTGFSIVARDSA